MLNLTDFETSSPLYQSDRTLILRGLRADGQQVVLKTTRSPAPTGVEVSAIRSEYNIGRRVSHPAVVRFLDLVQADHRPVLVMEDFGGQALSELLTDHQLSPAQVVRLAVDLAEALGALHEQGISHKDINPSNILINLQPNPGVSEPGPRAKSRTESGAEAGGAIAEGGGNLLAASDRRATKIAPPEASLTTGGLQFGGQVKLSDFGIASLLRREGLRVGTPQALEGTIGYMSPEQTGRTNRFIDYRTDFYSLGITLYELLTGALPFRVDDPAEMLHAHVARTPPLLSMARPGLPEPLSMVVMKMLAKTPEERYQSARGLAHDLRLCQALLEDAAEETQASFTPGSRDGEARFSVPGKLYGRRRERDWLTAALDRATEGSRVMAVLSGGSGIGKSALVRELQPEVLRRNGRFVSGKFRRDLQGVPHSALLQVMRELLQQALAQSEEELSARRDRLTRSLGDEAGALAEEVPELSTLLGTAAAPAPPPHLPPEAARVRLHSQAQTLLAEFARSSSPLVLFLDDLQWADAASLQLLELLLNNSGLHYVLVLATVRDDEDVDLADFKATFDSLLSGAAEVVELVVPPLEQDAVTRLVSDTTHTDAEEALPLARLIRHKSMGNPLYITQLLRTLHDRRLLTWDPEGARWTWDLYKVESVGVSDDVADLLAEKMGSLPRQTRELLELASLVGTRFDLGTLALLADAPIAAVVGNLHPAVEEGVISTVCGGFSHLHNACAHTETCESEHWAPEVVMQVMCDFHHDRIQQAAYHALPADRRPGLHLRLGRLLLANLDEAVLGDRLFEVVGHLNKGLSELSLDTERLDVARLNQRAGDRAMDVGGKQSARQYFAAGVELLPDSAWDTAQRLAFSLHLGHYTCTVLTDEDPNDVLARGEHLLAHAQGLTQRMQAMIPHVPQLSSRGRQPELCLERGAALLREVGIELLPDDAELAIAQEQAALQESLKGRKLEELAHLPHDEDELTEAATNLLETLFFFPIYMRRRELGPLAALHSIRLSLEHGNGPLSGAAYATWGVVQGHDRGDFAQGRRWCQLGMQVSDTLGSRQGMTRIIASLMEWVFSSPRQMVRWWRETYRLAQRTGVEFVEGMALNSICYNQLLIGRRLEELLEEGRTNRELIERRMPIIGPRELDFTLSFTETLLGLRPWQDLLFDSEQEQREAAKVMLVRNREALHWSHLLRSRLCLMFGNPRAALAEAEASQALADLRVGQPTAYDQVIHHALALACAAELEVGEEKVRLQAELAHKRALVASWVERGAEAPFGHDLRLLDAEVARAEGRFLEAGQAYDQAISLAMERRFLPAQALACERAAGFYSSHGLDRVALTYLRDAHYCYDKWGAAAKTQRLEADHPELGAGGAPATETTTTSTTGTGSAQRYDLLTILKANQRISREMDLDALLAQLLGSIMELGGAERGFLILSEDGDLQVAAARSTGEAEALLSEARTPLAACELLSAGVVQYVARTGEPAVLADATRQGIFRADPYVSRAKPRSVACLPLKNQGVLVGVVYLENNLVSGAFSEDRLQLAGLLCDGAAISIQNAHLYGELEQRVMARTRDLARKNQQLGESLNAQKEMQDQLIMQEKMASLGNLVAGVAHEINTPVGAIASSTDTSRRALKRLRTMLQGAADLEEVKSGRKLWRLVDMLEENHRVVGLASERVVEIVLSLRNFARLDEAERKQANLNDGVTSTLSLVQHRVKHGIEVATELGQLSPILCYPNQLNQVFMNLLTNAIDAVEEQPEGQRRITVRTWMEDSDACVQVSDNGGGVPDDVRNRIFDPGFTTKGVGVGTGLGLAICYNIVRKHRGKLELQSAPGEGATFTVRLPAGE